jgi:3-methyladenine DNA glycosylase AlkD
MTNKTTKETASLLRTIKKELSKKADAKTKETFLRFFKHDVNCYGVKNPLIRKIAKEQFKRVKALEKEEIFSLCEELFRSRLSEEAFIAAYWLDWISHSLVPGDMKTLERWIDQYIDDWAKCDTLCNHAIGSFLMDHPSLVSALKQWAFSSNLFVRRAAAVSLILPARKGLFLKEVFEISDILLLDKEDLVQKGYGWMLKEASRTNSQEVFSYLMKKKTTMPRTAFRYALEKMTPELRAIAMKR